MFSINSYRPCTRIAFTYVGTVIGAGFASGQEILRFFSIYGAGSYIAICISFIIFLFVGKNILEMGRFHDFHSFDDLIKHIFGKLSIFLNIYLIIALFVTLAAMFAGSGALFKQNFHFSFWAGSLVTAFLVIVTVVAGVKGLFKANSFLVPIIIFFNILLFSLVASKDNINSHNVYSNYTIIEIVVSGISYSCLNIILSIGVLVPLGSNAKRYKDVRNGAFLGSVMLGILLLTGNFCILSFGNKIMEYEIPMMIISKSIGNWSALIFTFVIWCGIFTTAIGNMFSITSVLKSNYKIPYYYSTIIISIGALFLATIGFSGIISTLYPVMGIIGFVFVMVLFLKRIYPKNDTLRGDG